MWEGGTVAVHARACVLCIVIARSCVQGTMDQIPAVDKKFIRQLNIAKTKRAVQRES